MVVYNLFHTTFLGARCLSFEKTVFIQVIWTVHVDAIIGTNKYNLLDLWKKNSQNKQRPWPSLIPDALPLEYQKRVEQNCIAISYQKFMLAQARLWSLPLAEFPSH